MPESLEMNFGMVGLGKMGANIVRRLASQNISSVVLDLNPDLTAELVKEGSIGAIDYLDLVNKLSTPRVIWVMVPAGVTGSTIESIAEYLSPGDTIIDGGNSYYKDDLINADRLALKGIKFVDVGTSGGVYGLERGYSLMIGGDETVVKNLDPIFRALSPGIDIAPRTAGRSGQPSSSEMGYLHCGPVGAGHYVKMIHNGIEYGMMAAFSEGLAIFDAAKTGSPSYNLDIAEISEVWRRGSVVASWLLDLTAEALYRDSTLSDYSTHVSDSGEGRWTVNAAIELGVPAPVLATSLFSRFASRDNDDFSNRILSAMRYQFGGHNESPKSGV
ncbi:MAG: decarboxylating 6-phosphogluconate dehydrogenase [Candidatus Nanopelagicaceae bacterium]|nr:decarboxylating 6-phosphogluconate dehydrogenase [Candidatus Nanopelagicaceae bacterium]